MSRGWRIARIGGVDVRVDPSWIVIALLLGAQFWYLFADPLRYPGVGTATSLGYALAATLLAFGSVLLHELAHAAVCRLRGIPVEGITLYMLGGATHARLESRGPFDEFLATAAGPATSIVLGGAFLALRAAIGPVSMPNPMLTTFAFLGAGNVFLGIFNLLPAFPMDGGRILRSIVWRTTGDIQRATLAASTLGRLVGWALVAAGLVLGLARQDLFWLWMAVIGYSVARAAGWAAVDARREQRLAGITAASVMAPPPPVVPAGLTVGEAVAGYLAGREGEAFPVMQGGRVLGFVSLGTVAGVAGNRPVPEAMAGPEASVTVAPEDTLDLVAERMAESDARLALVVDGGALVGVVYPETVAGAAGGG